MENINRYETNNCLQVIKTIRLIKQMNDEEIIKIDNEQNYPIAGNSAYDYNYIDNRDEIISMLLKKDISYFVEYGVYEDEEMEDKDENGIYINNMRIYELEDIIELVKEYNLTRISAIKYGEIMEPCPIGCYITIKNNIFKKFYENKNNIEGKDYLIKNIICNLIEDMIDDGIKNKEGYFNPPEVYDIGINNDSVIIFYGTCTSLQMFLKVYRTIFNFIKEDNEKYV